MISDLCLISQNFYAGESKFPGFDQSYVAIEWDHNNQSACAMGGTFFSDKYPEAYQGAYLYGDFSQGWMSTVLWDVDNSKPASDPRPFAKTTDGPVKFSIGPDGWIWYLAQCATCVGGGVLRALTYGDAWTPSWGSTHVSPKCDRPLNLVLPALPPGWQTAMYLSDLPADSFNPITTAGEWKPVANKNLPKLGDGTAASGPIIFAKDASIGTGNLDGKQMMIGGYRIRKGLGVHSASNLEISLRGSCYSMAVRGWFEMSSEKEVKEV